MEFFREVTNIPEFGQVNVVHKDILGSLAKITDAVDFLLKEF